ncbi:YkvA family protein [Nocardioides sp. 1609]|uniref:YkvA family protein n=1 Tax=Nocardioides sp. 1609 TaxID=2508327 RepID=UPI001ADB5BBE|nr:YkvA family protein [Nocardioides sp. 1609]
MDLSDLFVAVLVVLGVLVLVGLLVVGLVMWRYRVPPRGVVAMIGGLVYLASPIDVLPEALLGPLGLVDDAGVLAGVAIFVYKVVQVRQRLEQAGIQGRRRPEAGEPPA